MGYRTREKRDSNHTEICTELRKVDGVSVLELYMVGGGAPDLLVGYNGVDQLMEIKCREAGHMSKTQPLRPDQVSWHSEWKGRPVVVVFSVADALRAIGAVV
jgi:hypothetical protein